MHVSHEQRVQQWLAAHAGVREGWVHAGWVREDWMHGARAGMWDGLLAGSVASARSGTHWGMESLAAVMLAMAEWGYHWATRSVGDSTAVVVRLNAAFPSRSANTLHVTRSRPRAGQE